MEAQFEIIYPAVCECSVCLGPKIPFVTLPCGHSLCGTCAPQVDRCPECRARITRRITCHQNAEMVESSAVYHCRASWQSTTCTWSGTAAEAQHHRCNPLFKRFRPLVPGLEEGVFEAVLELYSALPPADVRDADVSDQLMQAMARQDADRAELQRTREQQQQHQQRCAAPAPPAAGGGGVSAAASPTTGTARPKTVIYWDYDNINQTKCGAGVGTTPFLKTVVKFLQEKGIHQAGRCWDAHTYFANDPSRYPADVIECLEKIQVECHLCSKKREAGDRKLSKHLRANAAAAMAAGHEVVLISDDGDFIETYKEVLQDTGLAVHVIHHAKGEHLDRLQVFTKSAHDIQEVFPAFTGLDNDAVELDPKQRINVEGQQVAVGALVANRQVRYLVAHAGSCGKWCSNASDPAHNPMACKFVHRRTVTAQNTEQMVTVEGQQVPKSSLVYSAQVEYLLANPGKSGRYCTNSEYHDYKSCRFVHKKKPCGPQQQPAAAIARPPPAAAGVPRPTFPAPPQQQQNHRPQQQFASPAPAAVGVAGPAPVNAFVTVEGQQVPKSSLVYSAQVEYLLANPGKSGRYCTNSEYHDYKSCRFVHEKKPCGHQQQPAAAAVIAPRARPPPAATGVPRPAAPAPPQQQQRQQRGCCFFMQGKCTMSNCKHPHRHDGPCIYGSKCKAGHAHRA
jgi:hypothetical protein